MSQFKRGDRIKEVTQALYGRKLGYVNGKACIWKNKSKWNWYTTAEEGTKLGGYVVKNGLIYKQCKELVLVEL